VAFAKQTIKTCQLDELVFLPESTPRGKQDAANITHRLALIEHATQDTKNTRVVVLASPRFTVRDTLPELMRLFTGSKITLLLGSDVVQTLKHWEGVELLLKQMSLAIGVRTTDTVDEITAHIHALEQQYSTAILHTLIATPESDMASSRIRNNAPGLSLLHPEVQNYIKHNNLYS
jgi:nicotinate (nicotinamide) nucleotide adenylyltransferase